MISGIFHQGSGLGDQLFRYITARVLTEKNNLEFGMFGECKADFFHNIYTYHELPTGTTYWRGHELKLWNEKDVRDSRGNDIRSYDPEINFVEDNTIIDGSFEDDKYWRHNLAEIDKWLAVEPLEVPDDTCLIGFRGGEYAAIPELFLDRDYWEKAIKLMVERGIKRFQVHTDDPALAKRFFPDFEIIDNTAISHSKHSNMGYNWRAMRYAKHAIIANSAFYILPRILSKGMTVAPRYWARRNTKVWARPACYYPEFTYV